MTQFSANLGFLWTELSLPDAIVAAKRAGFDAVECHWPFDVNPDDVKAALSDTGMSMLGLNTARGDIDKGQNGLASVPGREAEARAHIDEAIDYAMQIGTPNVHVMAGFAQGAEAHEQFLKNLTYALDKVAQLPVSILIEPLNNIDAPDYFLSTTVQAEAIIKTLNSEKLKLMFDIYHVQTMQGNVSRLFTHHRSHIGHVQFAAVPDRGPPGTGENDFNYLFNYIDSQGYAMPLGAEYKPKGTTEDSLGWLNKVG